MEYAFDLVADWWLYGNLLGHTHYPIHKDRVFKKPEKRVETEGFHGVRSSPVQPLPELTVV